jgi:hypothetical protein
MSRIILQHRKERLRITCGQCGDTKDIVFSIDPDRPEDLEVEIFDTIDESNEDFPEMLSEVTHLVT